MASATHDFWKRTSATASDAVSGGGGVRPEDLIEKTEQHWNVSATSVLVAWLLTATGGFLIFSIFSWRRERDTIIYMPRVGASKRRLLSWTEKCRVDPTFGVGVCPPAVPVPEEGFFGWMKPHLMDFWMEFWQLLHRKGIQQRDRDMLELLGLDAMTYLQFLRMLRWLFLSITLLVAVPLSIGNYYLNTHSEYGSAQLTDLQNNEISVTEAAAQASEEISNADPKEVAKSLLDDMLLFTAANVKGNGLWVHIGFEWMVTALVLGFVISHSWYHKELVQSWVELNSCEISFKSIMVTNLEIKARRKKRSKYGDGPPVWRDTLVAEAKIGVCKAIGIRQLPYSDPTTNLPAGCSVVLTHRNMTDLSERIDKFKEEQWPEFEGVLTNYLRKDREGKGRSRKYANLWKRIMGDATDWRARLDEVGKKLCRAKLRIESAQELAREHPDHEDILPIGGKINSAFITFPTAKIAHEALRLSKKRLAKKLNPPDVQRAPRSRNVIWKNLDNYRASKHGHAVPGRIAIIVVFFLNTIPLIAVTLLANMDVLVEQSDYLRTLRDSAAVWKGLFAAVGGVLPATLAALFAYLLPHVVRWLNRWSGALTRGQLDKTVMRQMFIFLLVSNFVVFSCLGIIWETYLTVRTDIGIKSWGEIWDSLGDIWATISKAYISQSAYWLSWFPIRAALICLQLLQLPRIATKLWQSLSVHTATELRALAEPESFDYAIEYIHLLFAMAVAIIYTPLAPIVAICSTIYFWAMSIVHYNILKFVEDTKETDGKCWNVARNRLLMATVLMQLLMMLTVGLKTKSPFMVGFAAVPIIFVLMLKWLEGHTRIFSKTAEIIGTSEAEAALIDRRKGDIPKFEHQLLADDWMPEFNWILDDDEEYQKAKKQFPWLEDLCEGTIKNGSSRFAKEKKGKRRWREEAKKRTRRKDRRR